MLMAFSGLILFSCSHQENESLNELEQYPPSEQKVEDMIKGYFDKQGWHYRMCTDEDSTINFRLRLEGNHEKLMLRVIILPNQATYHIICHSETILPQEAIGQGSIAMNDYNFHAFVVGGIISPKGEIYFWTGRNFDGNTFSEQAFAVDLGMVIRETDDETAQIYKQALMQKP